MVVVDTSVAIKWFLPENGSIEAKSLLRHDILAAPDMLIYELTNVLHCKKQLTDSDIQTLLADFMNFDIQLFALPSHKFSRVAELSRKFDISCYDASFIAMAELLETDMVTADHRLLRKVHKLNYVRGL